MQEKGRKIIATLVLISMLICGNLVPQNSLQAQTATTAKKISLSSKKVTVTKGKSKTIKVKNTKKAVKWNILSGKPHITLKKKGKIAVTIKGKKKGTAKVQAVIGKKKLICKVLVKDVENNNTLTPTVTNSPADTSNPAEEVAALKKLIAEQKELGATVSEELNNRQYTWDKEGHLISIDWDGCGLSGSIYFGDLPYLTKLNCGVYSWFEGYITNQLTGLDISRNEKLIELYCRNNQLTNLDVSNNVELKVLYCEYNELGHLDVSKNVNLTELCCLNDQLTSLDVSNNTNLEMLNCGSNQLTSLDVSKNVKLTELSCFNNQLSSLDVSKNINLKELYCQNNQLISLNIGNNDKLKLSWDGNTFSAPVEKYNNAY